MPAPTAVSGNASRAPPPAPRRAASRLQPSRVRARRGADQAGTALGQAFPRPRGTAFLSRFSGARTGRFRLGRFLIHRSGVRVPSGVPISDVGHALLAGWTRATVEELSSLVGSSGT